MSARSDTSYVSQNSNLISVDSETHFFKSFSIQKSVENSNYCKNRAHQFIVIFRNVSCANALTWGSPLPLGSNKELYHHLFCQTSVVARALNFARALFHACTAQVSHRSDYSAKCISQSFAEMFSQIFSFSQLRAVLEWRCAKRLELTLISKGLWLLLAWWPFCCWVCLLLRLAVKGHRIAIIWTRVKSWDVIANTFTRIEPRTHRCFLAMSS